MARAPAPPLLRGARPLSRNPGGASNTVCIAYARREREVSRAQGYQLIKRAWQQIAEDVDRVGIDRREMLSSAINQLQSTAGLARSQKNPGAVVGPVGETDALLGLGASSNARGQR